MCTIHLLYLPISFHINLNSTEISVGLLNNNKKEVNCAHMYLCMSDLVVRLMAMVGGINIKFV